MRNLKKFLALVLAMMMTLSLMVTVNAKNVEFDDGETVNDAFIDDLTVLAGMGVIKGMGDGTFKPQATVTRAEMAAIVYRLRTGDADADPEYKDKSMMFAGYGEFTDVKDGDWFQGYVGYCANGGLILGDGDGKFRPNDPVTGYEALVMLLRAMGYDQPSTFTGGDWRQRAATIATQRGMLAKVDTTSYRGTLMGGAAREVIAEITFQAATNATVKYDGVNYETSSWAASADGNLTRVLNPNLGYLNYGLTSETSVIIGNQATGEKYTLLGVPSTPYAYGSGAGTATVDTSYIYPGAKIAAADVTPEADDDIVVGTGLKLAGTTGLDLFGHKVTAWYNAKDTATAKQTYAVIDEATLAKTVYSPDATNGTKLSDGTKTDAKLGIEAQKAGFTVDLSKATARLSNYYARITGSDGKVCTLTGGKAATKSDNDLYALISNNDDKTVDVIISLKAEVAQITQKNTISTTPTVTLAGTGTEATDPAQIAASTFKSTGNSAGVINTKSLVEGSETTLGAKVAAWQVFGTNETTYFTAANKDDLGDAGTNSNMPYFQLDKLEESVTGTVLTYDATNNGKLTMSDGKVYERSYLWSKVVKGAIQTPLDASGNVEFEAGVNYTVWLDNDGRWLGATTSHSDFLYGTFADYTIGELGSAEMKYFVTGVTLDGKIVKNVPMTSLLQGGQPYPGTKPDVKTLGDGYSALTISQKNLGTTGNQITDGWYTGYLRDAEGNMDADGTKTAADYGKKLGDVRWLNAESATWTIKKSDVANGFADLNLDKTLLASANTKFVVVSGTGVNDVAAKVYTGIEALLDGYEEVTLDASAAASNATNTPYGNTYYIMASDRYNKWDTVNNKLVDTVILDARDLTYTGGKTLYFAYEDNVTDVKLAGTDPDEVKQYKLYNDGELGTYFVDIANVGGTDPNGAADKMGRFYELTEAYKVGNIPVYKATAVTSGAGGLDTVANKGICKINLSYIYTGTSFMGTVQMGTELFNVSNAKVVDVEYDAASCDHAEIKSVKDLNDAVSGLTAYSGGIKVAAVYDGVNVSVIYVTTVPANP